MIFSGELNKEGIVESSQRPWKFTSKEKFRTSVIFSSFYTSEDIP